MGKVLLIEPHKIVQQAISLYLFPEHEVKVEEHLKSSDIGSLKDYDLMIVDGAALREVDRLTPEIVRILQGCKAPMVWLEQNEPSHPPKREKLVIIKKPIEKEIFQSAVNDLLSAAAPSKERKVPLAVSSPKETAKKKGAEALPQAAFPFIDLVDVVEEQSSPKHGKKSPRKMK